MARTILDKWPRDQAAIDELNAARAAARARRDGSPETASQDGATGENSVAAEDSAGESAATAESAPGAAGGSLESLTRAQLLDLAHEGGVEVGSRDTKAEIIAALTADATGDGE